MAQEVLARDSDLEIRQLLAAYPELEPSVQLLLAKDESVSIRKALTKGGEAWSGSQLGEEVQLCLAKDRGTGMRLALAENHRLSSTAQVQLASDLNTSVKMKLLEESGIMNPLSPQAQQILAQDPSSGIRMGPVDKLFGFSPSASSEEIYLMLASDSDEKVRGRIIKHLVGPFSRGKCSDAVKARLLEGAEDGLREKLDEAERAREMDSSAEE
ncbi:hypothetical protein PS850_05234 [Pseudomonas fluorescens]|nr:hypothetical protein PS850_05234 [Pseudomonas fluorescens]